MKKLVLIFIAVFVLSVPAVKVSAQVLDGIYVKEHVPARKPVPYHYLREADLMWTKRIWRIIDLREKINHPLYYPTEFEIGARMSFMNLVVRAFRGDFADVAKPRLTLYEAGDVDNFEVMEELSDQEVAKKIYADAIDSLSTSPTGSANAPNIDWDGVWASTKNVKKLMIKEDWYFDKQRAKMEVRIVGICPIIAEPQYNDMGEITDTREKQLFWVYFPEARAYFADHEVFNPYNDAERRTFDDIFFKRKFSSYIFKESNVYDNRTINSFKYGLDALLESERIKDWMFQIEHDLWEY